MCQKKEKTDHSVEMITNLLIEISVPGFIPEKENPDNPIYWVLSETGTSKYLLSEFEKKCSGEMLISF